MGRVRPLLMAARDQQLGMDIDSIRLRSMDSAGLTLRCWTGMARGG